MYQTYSGEMPTGAHGVLLSTPFDPSLLGSTKRCTNMLIGQHDYPAYIIKKVDRYDHWDSDRLMSHFGFDHWQETLRDHCQKQNARTLIDLCHGEPGLEFVSAMMKSHDQEWTGFRVMATTNQMSGFIVYSFELFFCHPDHPRDLFSGEGGDNVVRPKRIRFQDHYGEHYRDDEDYDI